MKCEKEEDVEGKTNKTTAINRNRQLEDETENCKSQQMSQVG